jgi:hypothetical protein
MAMALLVLTGCERESDSSRQTSKPKPLANNFVALDQGDSPPKADTPMSQLPPPPAPPEAPKAPETAQNQLPPPPAPPDAPKAPETAQNQLPPPPAPPAAQEPETVKKPAAVGVGKKGRGYGKGVIATPAASLWATREKLAFQVLIPEAMKLFKAMNDNKGPKSHEEFMEKIIKENMIKLPELPEGDRYMYDPKTEQLMVESPKPE